MGYVYIFFAVWAAINDPIFGQWLDKRPYRKGIGKYRLAFVRSIPFLVVVTLAFPWASPSWSQLGISIYLFFALTLWETAGTLFGITYGAVATNLFIGKRLIDFLEIRTGRRRPGTVKGVIGVLMTPGNAIYVFIRRFFRRLDMTGPARSRMSLRSGGYAWRPACCLP
jgi:Na+/melibiose symporter-like transporter